MAAHGWASCSCPRGGTASCAAAPVEKRKCGAKASQKAGAQRDPHSTSARGHGRKSTKVVANLTLLDVEMGASDELPLAIRKSFKDGQ
jgi:hypothetical protein